MNEEITLNTYISSLTCSYLYTDIAELFSLYFGDNERITVLHRETGYFGGM